MLCPFAFLPTHQNALVSPLGDLCGTLGFPRILADASLINVSSAELGTYNPGACLTSPAACLIVSPNLPCSSNLFMAPSLPHSWPHPSRSSSFICPCSVQQRGLYTESDQLCLSNSSVLLFGWLLTGLPAQRAPPQTCCRNSFQCIETV